MDFKLQKPSFPGTVRKYAAQFAAMRSIDDLTTLVRHEQYKLALIASHPRYDVYEIPKKNGSFRLIEDPEPNFKAILRTLNHYLQCHYYTIRPDSVYGFCISTRNEEDRNIINNARCHIGHPYMLNIDMKDFFHIISKNRVNRVFETHFNLFDEQLIDILANITTYNGRLPMGSPTSPVISNYATIDLDAELGYISSGCALTYTRFADDLTFSSQHPIEADTIKLLREAIENYGYIINEEKVRLCGIQDEKSVTGIVVQEDNISLPGTYIPQLIIEIGRLKTVMQVEQRYRTGMSYKKLKLLKQELQGKIAFATSVMGQNHASIINMEEQYEDAVNPVSDFESATWLELPYDFS